jgi:SAM-dependent methyltransferase
MSVRTLQGPGVDDVFVSTSCPDEVSEVFERAYAEAHGDVAMVPWCAGRPNPAIVAWLNAEASAIVRPGSRVVVVGCGLGDDVAELSYRGYDVVGFDISQAAIDWAKERHVEFADRFIVADLFDLPSRMLRRFDLVIEAYTIESVPASMRPGAARAVASLSRPHGLILAVCCGRDEQDADESGSSLCVSELSGLFAEAGMCCGRGVDDFMDDEDPPVRRLRALFQH